MFRQLTTALRLLTIAMLLLAGTAVWAADGRVLMVQGNVTIDGQPVTTRTEVNGGDTIKAGSDGTATIVMADNSVLNVQPNSEIAIGDFVFNANDQSQNVADVNIVRGTLRYISGQIAKSDPDKVSIRAGTATIGIRGTVIEATFDGVTVTVNTSLGTVTISSPGRAPVTIPVGNAGTTDANGNTSVAPAAPLSFVTAAQNIANDADTANAEITNAGDDGALVVAALAANAAAMGGDADSVNAAVAAVAATSPNGAAMAVFIASVIMPEAAASFATTATDTLTDTLGDDAAGIISDVDDATAAAADATVTGGTSSDGGSGDGAGSDPDSGDTGSNDSDNSAPPFSGDPANTNDPNASG